MKTKRAGLVFILAITLVLVGVIGYQAFKPEQVMAASQSMVGAWTVTVTSEGDTFTDIAIFSSDGTVTIMESDGRLGLGVWQKLQNNRYAFSFWEYYVEDGTTFQVNITSTIELSRDKEQYTGPFFFQIYDVDGNLIVEGPGTATGVRQPLEPMPGE